MPTNALKGCSALESITVFGEELDATFFQVVRTHFERCPHLKHIQIPSSIAVGNETFLASEVRSVVFPTSTRSIGYGAFQDCQSLVSVDLSKCENCKHSGSLQMGMLVLFKDTKNSTIMNCKSLIKVERDSFRHCASLQTFDLSDCCHLETIATECCANNASVTSSLASLIFLSSLKAIHWYVFQHEMNR